MWHNLHTDWGKINIAPDTQAKFADKMLTASSKVLWMPSNPVFNVANHVFFSSDFQKTNNLFSKYNYSLYCKIYLSQVSFKPVFILHIYNAVLHTLLCINKINWLHVTGIFHNWICFACPLAALDRFSFNKGDCIWTSYGCLTEGLLNIGGY